MRLGRLTTHFVHLHPQYSSEKEDKKMDIKCLNCGCEVDLAQACLRELSRHGEMLFLQLHERTENTRQSSP